ncbi:hypothetical protein CR513_01366, partial [Mucuna pruriens]
MKAAENREEELRRQIAALRAAGEREEEPEEMVTPPFWGQPFCKEIDETAIPPNFREIIVEPFDGSQDPHAHLQAFQTQIYISGGNDRLSCKLFPGTLRGVAMQWMYTLPPRSIQTFRDLAGFFLSQFAANKVKRLEVADLFDVGSVWADAQTARRCYEDSLRVERFSSRGNVNILDLDLDPRGQFEKEGPLPAEELKEITLGPKQGQTTRIGTAMSQAEEGMLIAVLVANHDVFAWSAQDMPGVDPEFVCHQLSVDSNAKPVAQKKRKMGEEKREAAKQETRKLVAAGFV